MPFHHRKQLGNFIILDLMDSVRENTNGLVYLVLWR